MSTFQEHEIDIAYRCGKRDLCRERGHGYATFEHVELPGIGRMVLGTCDWCGHQRAVWSTTSEVNA